MTNNYGGFPGDFEDDDDDPNLPSGTPDEDGVVRLNKPKARAPKPKKKRAIKSPKKRPSPARRRRGGTDT